MLQKNKQRDLSCDYNTLAWFTKSNNHSIQWEDNLWWLRQSDDRA